MNVRWNPVSRGSSEVRRGSFFRLIASDNVMVTATAGVGGASKRGDG